uniref:Uncharacterized protein n=1 Tax=Arundo donax TaxID=35708 RepID=A0A0A8ZWI4_ARUDO
MQLVDQVQIDVFHFSRPQLVDQVHI